MAGGDIDKAATFRALGGLSDAQRAAIGVFHDRGMHPREQRPWRPGALTPQSGVWEAHTTHSNRRGHPHGNGAGWLAARIRL